MWYICIFIHLNHLNLNITTEIITNVLCEMTLNFCFYSDYGNRVRVGDKPRGKHIKSVFNNA